MKKQFKNHQNTLFILTLFFFLFGMIHISFSLLGLFCFSIPFIQYITYNDPIWCKYYCPRAGFLNKVLNKISLRKPLPKFLKSVTIKKAVLYYFGINLFFIIMSTLMVTLGRIVPMDYVRFLIVFELPIPLPQLYDLSLPPSIIHLSYRIYSMMFTSTVLGIILGIIYKPRAWCTLCPIKSLTS